MNSARQGWGSAAVCGTAGVAHHQRLAHQRAPAVLEPHLSSRDARGSGASHARQPCSTASKLRGLSDARACLLWWRSCGCAISAAGDEVGGRCGALAPTKQAGSWQEPAVSKQRAAQHCGMPGRTCSTPPAIEAIMKAESLTAHRARGGCCHGGSQGRRLGECSGEEAQQQQSQGGGKGGGTSTTARMNTAA